jgi:predicted RND superfamily exporter protein
MFVTSLTSAGAFASCIGSRIMPIQAFGIFSAIVVPLVFVQTVVILPVIYYFYEKYIMNSSYCCCCSKTKTKKVEQKSDFPELRLESLASDREHIQNDEAE